MRQCVEIEPEWLTEVAGHYFHAKDIQDDVKRKMPKAVGRAYE